MVTKRKSPEELKVRAFTEEDDETIRRMYANNATDAAIGKKLKRHPQVIKGRRQRKLGLVSRTSGPRSSKPKSEPAGEPKSEPDDSSKGWTDERVERLKACRAAKYSILQCAKALGVTRGSAAGKLNSLGFLGKHKTGAGATTARGNRKRRAPTNTRSFGAADPRFVCDGITDLKADDAPVDQRCSLIELDEGKCSWPTNDRTYCGGKVVRRVVEIDARGVPTKTRPTPYCGYHAAMAYQPLPAKRSSDNGTSEGFEEQEEPRNKRRRHQSVVLSR